MKKRKLGLLLSCAMLFAMAGCGNTASAIENVSVNETVNSQNTASVSESSYDMTEDEQQIYEIYRKAVNSGYTGTYDEWLASIKGEKGDKGDTGEQGPQGEKGDKGDKGDTGATGNGIVSIEKTSSDGLVDTYTITLSDGSTFTFTVTNGRDGKDAESSDDQPDTPSEDADEGTEGLMYYDQDDGTLAVGVGTASELSNIEIPSTHGGKKVTGIIKDGFSGCTNLKTINIPSSIETIGIGAFSGCKNIESLTVASDNPKFDSRNDCNAVIETSTNTLVCGCVATVVPDDVTAIGDYAFYGCTGLSSLNLPENVTSIGNYAFAGSKIGFPVTSTITSIGDYAFSDCTSLRNIKIPDNVSVMGTNVFLGCSNLTSINCIVKSRPSGWNYSWSGCSATIRWNYGTAASKNLTITSAGVLTGIGSCKDTDIIIPSEVTEIGEAAFRNNNNITSVTMLGNVKTIDQYAFQGCKNLVSCELPGGLEKIEAKAFGNCTSLKSINIPYSVTDLQSYPFYDCSGLESITVDAENTKYDSRNDCNAIIRKSGNKLCLGCKNTTIPEDVTNIRPYAFYGCSGLTSIDIPEGVTSIGNDAFCGCSGLTSINIPEGITLLDGDVFSGCSGLTSINIPEGVTSIGAGAFYGCSGLTSISIPDGVVSIGSEAFRDCSGLTSLEISENVTSIGSAAFADCTGLESITVDPENTVYDSRDNCNAIIEKASGVLLKGCDNSVIPDGVTAISGYAFSGCSGLTSINIPVGITSIDEHVFSGCSGLISANIPEGLTSFGDYAFSGCSALTSINIPEGVTSIGLDAFYGCSGLTSINIPASVTTICSAAFNGCGGLQSITVDSLNTVYDSREDCNAIISIATNDLLFGCNNTVIPDSVVSIESSAFSYCKIMTSIKITASVTSIGMTTFKGCSGLKNITVDSKNTVYDSRENCNAIIITAKNTVLVGCQNTIIPSDVTKISNYAFYNCCALASITIPSSVTSICSEAFYGCAGLTSIAIPDSVTSIGSEAFSYCNSLTDIYCYAESQPSGWASDWYGDSNATVHWGYTDGD